MFTFVAAVSVLFLLIFAGQDPRVQPLRLRYLSSSCAIVPTQKSQSPSGPVYF